MTQLLSIIVGLISYPHYYRLQFQHKPVYLRSNNRMVPDEETVIANMFHQMGIKIVLLVYWETEFLPTFCLMWDPK